MTNLFVYGSLMNDEIVYALTSSTFKKTPAVLKGYFVAKLVNKATPGMVREKSSMAKGQILLNIDNEALRTICEWEGCSYKLIDVTPGDFLQDCVSFLWLGDTLGEEWSNETFRQESLNWYLETDIPNFLRSTTESS